MAPSPGACSTDCSRMGCGSAPSAACRPAPSSAPCWSRAWCAAATPGRARKCGGCGGASPRPTTSAPCRTAPWSAGCSAGTCPIPCSGAAGRWPCGCSPPPSSTRSATTRCAICWRICWSRHLLTHPSAPRLTVAATDVETGEAVLFDNASITVEVLVASSCLPFVFPAVRIGERAYWDGGYAGNPPLGPLLTPTPPDELVLIRAQPGPPPRRTRRRRWRSPTG